MKTLVTLNKQYPQVNIAKTIPKYVAKKKDIKILLPL